MNVYFVTAFLSVLVPLVIIISVRTRSRKLEDLVLEEIRTTSGLTLTDLSQRTRAKASRVNTALKVLQRREKIFWKLSQRGDTECRWFEVRED